LAAECAALYVHWKILLPESAGSKSGLLDTGALYQKKALSQLTTY